MWLYCTRGVVPARLGGAVQYLVRRVRTNDAASGVLTWREGLRAALLHIVGGVCAIALLVVGVSVFSHYFPHTRDSLLRFAGSVWSSDDEPKTASSAVIRTVGAPEPVQAVRRVHRRRMPIPRPPEPTRAFAPPPAAELPSPQLAEDGPMIMAVAHFPSAVPEMELAALPPKPANPVLRILAALAHPFRLLGGLFHRRHEAPRHIVFEEFGEPVE